MSCASGIGTSLDKHTTYAIVCFMKKPTTVRLTDTDRVQLQKLAERNGRTEAQEIRAAINAHLAKGKKS